MSTDDRDVSQLRSALWEFIHDAQSEIHANIGVGIWRGHSDPTVQKMQRTVTTLIARVREEMQPDCVCKCQRGYAAALRDAVAAIKALHSPVAKFHVMEVQIAYDIGQREAVAAIEALGGER